MALLDELGLDTYPQYTTGSKILQIEADKVQSYKSDIPSLSLLSLIELELFIRKVDRLSKRVDCRDPFSCADAEEWDSKSLETFLNESFWTKAAYETVKVAIRVTVTMEPSQMSVLYFLTLVSSAGGLIKLIEAKEYTAQELKVKGGTQQISQIMAERIGKDKILLQHPVETISQDEDSVTVSCQNGLKIKCQRVIVAAPPMVTKKISFVPRLSNQRREMEKWMPFGNYIKIIVTYKEAFWKVNGQSGEVVTYGGLSDVTGCDVGPLSVVFDATSADGSPALVTFIAGDQAIQWGCQDAPARKAAVLKSLQKWFGAGATDSLDYVEKDWSGERYIEGCVAGVGPGAMRNFAAGLRDPQGRIHMAGSESATEWIGYISGAIQAGTRAANEVLFNIRPGTLSKGDISGTYYDPSFKIPPIKNKRHPLISSFIVTLSFIIGLGSMFYMYYWKRE